MKFNKAKATSFLKKLGDLALIGVVTYGVFKLMPYAEGKASGVVSKMKKPVTSVASTEEVKPV